MSEYDRAMNVSEDLYNLAGVIEKNARTVEFSNLAMNMDLEIARSETRDVIQAAARLANALRDINNEIGEIPAIKERYAAVYDDVDHYSGL